VKLRIINAAEVRELLPMDECVDAMGDAMQAASAGAVRVPPRLLMPLIDDSGYLGLMPGSSAEPRVYGAKVVSLHPSNPAAGLPAIQGFVTLFDHDTGTPLTIIEGGTITAIRTAAASALATRYLAREDARSHGIFGTGVQAVTHIDAILAVRPVDEVVLWGRNADKAEALAKEHSARTGIAIRATKNPEEAAACDIVSTVTGATEPILHGAWLRAGAHVNLVGAHSPKTREADSDVIANASLFTDLLESLFNEAGDVLIPLAKGRISRSDIKGEIGRVVSGELAGRSNDDEITVYKSLGVTAQDLFAAQLVWSKAAAAGRGVEVEFGD
jgi:ornithine cyclodeaminase/alanine dehydrogenase-like protein (mu-crystallin family)